MRHLLANLAVYVIGAILVLGAAIFAWLRSEQVMVSHEPTVFARFDPSIEPSFQWRQLGADSYERNCRNCHAAAGTGWDQYPGLGHTAALQNAPAGRDYVIDLHLYGLSSVRWRAPMPPMGHMTDVELAAVINYVLAQFSAPPPPDDGALYLPADIAARRNQRLTPAQMNRRRPASH